MDVNYLLHPGCTQERSEISSLTLAENNASISAAVVGSVFVVFICIADLQGQGQKEYIYIYMNNSVGIYRL